MIEFLSVVLYVWVWIFWLHKSHVIHRADEWLSAFEVMLSSTTWDSGVILHMELVQLQADDTAVAGVVCNYAVRTLLA